LVRLIELTEGQLDEHASDRHETLLLLSGAVSLSGDRWPERLLAERHLSLLPPGETIALRAIEPCRLIVCRLIEEVKYCGKSEASGSRPVVWPGEPRFLVLPFKEPIARFAEGLAMDIAGGLDCEPYLICKFTELMFLLKAYYTEDELEDLFHPLVQNPSDFQTRILSLESQVHTAKELADRCHMTEVGFRKRFKAEMGVPPKEYLLQRKKHRLIRELRRGTKTNYELCEEYGFTSASGLTNFCRLHLGGTPSDLRRK